MKKSNFTTFLILLLLSFNAFARFDRAQKQELTRKVFKSEQVLKSAFENDIKSTFGVKEVFVDVKLTVNSYAIFREISVFDDGWKEIRDMQLPSMFIDPEQQLQLRELKTITNEHILSHVKSLKLIVSSPYDVLNEVEFRNKLETIIASNIVNFKKIKLDIELKKIEPLLKDSRKGSISNPYFKLDLEDFKPEKFKNFFGVLIGIFCIGIILYALFLLTIKSSVKSLKNAVVEKEFTGSLTTESSQPYKPQEEEKRLLPTPSNNSANLSLNSYYEKLELLKSTINGDFTYIKEMIELELAIKSKNEICILLAVLPSSERSKLYEQLQKEDILQIKSTIFSNGEKLFNDIHVLCETIDGIQKLITLTSLKEENFYHFYLKKIVQNLSKEDVIFNLKTGSSPEFYYLIENISRELVSEILANAEELEIPWHESYSHLSDDMVKPFIKQLASKLNGKDEVEYESSQDPRFELLPLLSGAMEAQALASLNMSSDFKFTNLVSRYFEVVKEKVKKMDFESMCSFMAILNKDEREKIILTLPEVLAERTRLRDFHFDAQTYKIKASIHKELIALHSKSEEKEDGFANPSAA